MMMRRRRPLLRGAMIGGAGVMAGRASARRADQEAEQEARLEALESTPAPAPAVAAAPVAAAPAAPDLVSRLQDLKALQDQGVLTPEEFETAKQKLLSA